MLSKVTWWSNNFTLDWDFPGFLSESNSNVSVYLWQVNKCMSTPLEKPRAWRKQTFTVTLDVGRKMEERSHRAFPQCDMSFCTRRSD